MEATKTLKQWATEIHQNAMEHGWWDNEISFGEIEALCHSELSEALEHYRKRDPMVYGCCGYCGYDEICDNVQEGAKSGCKPEGIAVEMIDCMMRILDWCAAENIDVDAIIEMKHEFNKTRPYRHAGKVI